MLFRDRDIMHPLRYLFVGTRIKWNTAFKFVLTLFRLTPDHKLYLLFYIVTNDQLKVVQYKGMPSKVVYYLPSHNCTNVHTMSTSRTPMAPPNQRAFTRQCSLPCASPEWCHPPPRRKKPLQRSSLRSTASISLMER